MIKKHSKTVTYNKSLSISLTEIDKLFDFKETPPEGWYKVREIAKMLGFSYSHMRSIIQDLNETKHLKRKKITNIINDVKVKSPYYNLREIEKYIGKRDKK